MIARIVRLRLTGHLPVGARGIRANVVSCYDVVWVEPELGRSAMSKTELIRWLYLLISPVAMLFAGGIVYWVTRERPH